MTSKTAFQSPRRGSAQRPQSVRAAHVRTEGRALPSLNSKRGVACNTPLFDYMSSP